MGRTGTFLVGVERNGRDYRKEASIDINVWEGGEEVIFFFKAWEGIGGNGMGRTPLLSP